MMKHNGMSLYIPEFSCRHPTYNSMLKPTYTCCQRIDLFFLFWTSSHDMYHCMQSGDFLDLKYASIRKLNIFNARSQWISDDWLIFSDDWLIFPVLQVTFVVSHFNGMRYRVLISRIFSSNLFQSWYSIKTIWQYLRAMKRPHKECQKHYCWHLTTDLGSQWLTFFCGCVRVLMLVFQSMGSHCHHHHQLFSR